MEQKTLVERITAELEQSIVEGVYCPGDRLPPERVLAGKLEVSRPSLRNALKALAAKGILRSRQGGGHYVTDSLTRTMTDPLLEMLGQHPDSRNDVLEFRFPAGRCLRLLRSLKGNRCRQSKSGKNFLRSGRQYDGWR